MTNKSKPVEHNEAFNVDALKAKVHDVAEKIKDKSHELKEQVVHHSEVAKDKVLKAEKDVSGYVKKNPWRALGIATVVGVVLGKIIKKRK